MPRPKGSPNKNKRELKARLKQLLGEDFDPVVRMAEMAVALHENATSTRDPSDQKSALDGWDKVAQYVEPKLKAIEVSGEIDSKHTVKIVDLTGSLEELDGDDSVSD